jgi:formylmethanofuran dehydrogenase subunit E
MKSQELAAVIQFHGHFCPGLAIGVRAAELALGEIGPHAADEEVIAIVETDMCGVDAIQFMTGCTFGKGNLIHLDYGKNAFTFIRRSDGKAIRLVMRPQPQDGANTEHRDLMARIRSGEASSEERSRFQDLHQQRGREILDLPLERLFDVQTVEPRIPAKARVRDSIQCEACGEMVMETRIRLMGGRKLCIPCFEVRERRL